MEAKKMIDKTLAGEGVIKAMDKLKKDKVDISINPKRFLLEFSKEELKKLQVLDVSVLSKEEIALVEQSKKNYQANIDGYALAKLEATMVPLKYKDLQVIKDGVLEALKYSREFNWDDDIRMKSMLREEHTLTVYLSLRKKDNVSQRYYVSLEEIAKETETTIDEMYNIYLDSFVLTDEERKNS